MPVRIAINGLGRIGRCIARAYVEYHRDDIEIVAVNGPAPIEDHLHFLTYDSVHGYFPHASKQDDQTLLLGGKRVKVFGETNPAHLPWGDLGIDVVLECTGKFKTVESASTHIRAGAKRVIISSPADSDNIPTIVYGVNNDTLSAKDTIISIGSCTTNCLAPIAKILDDLIGIEQGFMTTVHAYTNDQNLVDSRHKDLRRARAAALSIIPASTGAAKAIGLVLPGLKGKLDGVAVRVPTPNVSLVDLCFSAKRPTTADEIHQAIIQAADGPMKGVLAYTNKPLVSIDFNHNPYSSTFDLTGTKIIGGTFCRVASWYDNEWGFSVRMLDVARQVGCYD